MLTSKQCFIFLGILSLNTPLLAQIVTDGTLGIETSLTGQNIEIPADLGQQHGNNLFHSFKEFNINTGETATFTGPDAVQNILTRVTGGQRSFIDGTLRSEIPNANLYLLNPSGILFGKNASLDISGSFHASTADGVNLGGDGKFLARSPNNSVLTAAPPSDFGFLDSQPASIEIQGDTLTIKNHTYYAPNGQINVTADSNIYLEDSTLYAPNGQIKITSPNELRILQTSQELFKQFDINEDGEPEVIANLDVSGRHGGGKITLGTHSLVSNGGGIFADTWGDKQEIEIYVDDILHLTNIALITAGNFGSGQQRGSIKITARGSIFLGLTSEELEQILTENELPPVTPELVENGFRNFFSQIGTGNFSSGSGADISIATPRLEVSYGLIEAFTVGSGNAGNTQINASQVNLHDYGFINAAVGKIEELIGSGRAGNIRLRDIDGINPTRQISLSNHSTISVSTVEDSSGDAGNIDLKTLHLTLGNRSSINSFSYGTGQAGAIFVETNTALLSDIPDGEELKTGIYTEADYAGGGDINLLVHDRLEVVNSKITAESRGTRPQDKGGNLIIRSPKIFTLDNSRLLANAYAGNGGNIILETHQFDVRGDQWEINVSSQLGWNGQFVLNHTKLNDLVTPEKTPLPELPLLTNRCASFSKDNLSRFLITARDILPHSPEDLRTYTMRLPRRDVKDR